MIDDMATCTNRLTNSHDDKFRRTYIDPVPNIGRILQLKNHKYKGCLTLRRLGNRWLCYQCIFRAGNRNITQPNSSDERCRRLFPYIQSCHHRRCIRAARNEPEYRAVYSWRPGIGERRPCTRYRISNTVHNHLDITALRSHCRTAAVGTAHQESVSRLGLRSVRIINRDLDGC